jgi:hypothetical protein
MPWKRKTSDPQLLVVRAAAFFLEQLGLANLQLRDNAGQQNE